jgi:hypothetical protein
MSRATVREKSIYVSNKTYFPHVFSMLFFLHTFNDIDDFEILKYQNLQGSHA